MKPGLPFFFALSILWQISFADNPYLPEPVFIENKGQVIDLENKVLPGILYTCESAGIKVGLRKEGVSYVMSSAGDKNFLFHRIDMDFVNANPDVKIIRSNSLQGDYNYYFPHCPEGILGVKSYAKIIYENIYPNVDIIFYGDNTKGLKYDIIIKPGGNPDNIQLKYAGQDNIEIKNDELRIKTSLGEMVENMPKVYQNINGKIVDIKAAYKMDGAILAFHLNTPYSALNTLIIDPWLTYCGGNGLDEGRSIAADVNGNAIVTGRTGSSNFPVSLGAFQTIYGGGSDGEVFIIKFDANGIRQWSTFYGGSATDHGNGIVTDAAGNIIVTGQTFSANFPVTVSSFQPGKNGAYDAFLINFNSAGIRQWATFIGGGGIDYGYAVDVDNTGNIIVTGTTSSNDFPVTSSAFQTQFGGSGDVFLVKFNAVGVRQWGTYFGGSNDDIANGITTDNNGNIIVTGQSDSPDMPVSNAFQPVYSGSSSDVFLAKFSAAGSLQWSTYYGGNNFESGYDIDADKNNNVVITGRTSSTNFPVSAAAYQAGLGGGVGYDAFILKFNSTGNRVWSTYFGGSGTDVAHGISVDTTDNINICGMTATGIGFPTASCAYQPAFGGGPYDNFIARFDTAGYIKCATYVGGFAHDQMYDSRGNIATSGGKVYFTAYTPGTHPVTAGAFQSTYGGGFFDAIVGQFCLNTCGDNVVATNFSASKTSVCVGEAVDYTSFNTVSCDSSNMVWDWSFQGGTPSTATSKNPSGIVYTIPGTYQVKLIAHTLCGSDSVIKAGYIVVNSLPVISVTGATSVCEGDTGIITLNGGTSYTWSPSVGLSATTGSTVACFSTQNTTYTVSTTDSNGCSSQTNVVITVDTIPLVSISNDTTICEGNSVMLTAAGGSGYSWNTSAGTSSISVLPAPGNTIYTVTVTNGGCIAFADVLVTVSAAPAVDAGSNITLVAGASAVLSGSGSGNAYQWNPPAGLSCTDCPAPEVNTTETTTYYLTVTDSNGCSGIDSVIVYVEIICGNIFIPNAFSPNEDGVNDFLQPILPCATQLYFAVLNRWGNTVYETDNVSNAWDGKFNGEYVDTGVYTYILNASFINGSNIKQHGNITVIR